ncbi:GNAT family N-acetyltransferase [Actinomycetes bacterium M1A6_2h]
MPQRFETAGLRARRITEDDLPFVELMHSDAASMAPIGGVRDHATSVEYLRAATSHWTVHGFGMYLLFDGDVLAGRAGIKRDGADIELAYSLLPIYWGRGIATTVATDLVRLATEHGVPAGRLVAYTRVDNISSRHVMAKAGLRFDCEIRRGDSLCVRYTRTNVITASRR